MSSMSYRTGDTTKTCGLPLVLLLLIKFTGAAKCGDPALNIAAGCCCVVDE